MSPKLINKILFGINIIVYVFIISFGFLNIITGNEMGYVILNFYIIIPLISFISSLYLTLKKLSTRRCYLIIFGFAAMLMPYLIFKSFSFISLFFSFIPSLVAIFIGTIINKLRKK